MEFLKRNYSQILIALVLILGLLLRLNGVTYGNIVPIHPDEISTNMAFRQMHPDKFDFNPDYAHIEGTFYYYVLAVAVAFGFILNRIGIFIGLTDFTLTLQTSYELLIIGRILTIIISVIGIYCIYYLIKNLKMSTISAVLAALMATIIPINVIYGHYMRPHILANVLLTIGLIVLFTTFDKNKRHIQYGIAGFVFGILTSTRYNMAIALIIPAIILIYDAWQEKKSIKEFLFNKLNYYFAAAFIGGVFLGDPYLFISYSEMQVYLELQRSYVPEGAFAFNNLLNIENPIKYLTFLIPVSTGKLLAFGIYASMLIALFHKKYLRLILPLTAFFLVYTYLMGKGYATPIYPRAILPLLLTSSISVAVANDYLSEIKSYKLLKFVFLIVISVGLILAASML